jgi:hypothetical protein
MHTNYHNKYFSVYHIKSSDVQPVVFVFCFDHNCSTTPSGQFKCEKPKAYALLFIDVLLSNWVQCLQSKLLVSVTTGEAIPAFCLWTWTLSFVVLSSKHCLSRRQPAPSLLCVCSSGAALVLSCPTHTFLSLINRFPILETKGKGFYNIVHHVSELILKTTLK